jgi:hypothetical protein
MRRRGIVPRGQTVNLPSDGYAYSNILLPKSQCHRFGGDCRERKGWPDTGTIVRATNVARIRDAILELTNPATNPSPTRVAMGGLPTPTPWPEDWPTGATCSLCSSETDLNQAVIVIRLFRNHVDPEKLSYQFDVRG